MRTQLSIVICTFNRASKLRHTLESLGRLILPPDLEWEVLVVDNGSTDDTKRIAQDFYPSPIPMLSYLYEPKRGKSFALSHGVRKARGHIIAVTDDDCIVDPKWATAILSEFSQDPCVNLLGGRVELYDSKDEPISIRTSRERTVIGTPLQAVYCLIGCNMAFTRGMYDALRGFDLELGPGSGARTTFDDPDFVYRAFVNGFKIIYSPEALVFHDHGRRTGTEVASLTKEYLRGRGAFYCKHILRMDRRILKLAIWEYVSLIKPVMRNFALGKTSHDNLRTLSFISWGGISRFFRVELRNLLRGLENPN